MTLFGPVLPYDLIRVARRGRYIMLRTIFALVLLGLLYLSYRSYGQGLQAGFGDPKELSKFAEHFFHLFLLTQFVMIYVLTPAYVGDAIAEEKQRGTLEYLLTTQLTAREIVLGKLMSRLANVFLFLLVGLPILSMTQLFGGVSFDLLWGGFAALFVTLLSVGAMSIFLSVHARTPRDATMLAFLIIICYFVGWGVFAMAADRLRSVGSSWPTVALVSGFVRTAYDAGNPFMAFFQLQNEIASTGKSYGDVLPSLLMNYAFFHGTIIFLCIAFSVYRLRRAFRAHRFTTGAAPDTEKSAKSKTSKKPRKSRNVWERAMLWKELRSGRGMKMGRLARILSVLLALGCLAPAVFEIVHYCSELATPRITTGSWRFTSPDVLFAAEMHGYVQSFGTLLSCILLLAVGVRAAGTIGSERDRQTLDDLLASPLTVGEIVFAKWLGSLLATRGLLALIGVIWLIGVLTGGLDLIAVPFLIVILAIYMIFMTSLGTLFAVWTKQTIRAVMATLTTGVFVGCGSWVCLWMISTIFSTGGLFWLAVPVVVVMSLMYSLILAGLLLVSAIWAKTTLRPRLGPGMTNFLVFVCPPVCFVVVLAMISDAWQVSRLPELIATGLTPPAVLAHFAFPVPANEVAANFYGAEERPVMPFCAIGVFIFGVAGCFLGLAARDHFRRHCGRIDTKDAPAKNPSTAAVQLTTAWGP